MNDPIMNREQAAQLYALFGGDVTKTAHVLGLRPVDVLKVAEEEGWTEKFKAIIELQKSSAPGEVQRGLNRAINFVQAHRMRLLLERALDHICGLTPTQLETYLLSAKSDKLGVVTKVLTTRALTDLSSAIEKCHAMTYLSLSDTAQDRGRRKESAEEIDGGAMHAAIAAAMSGIKQSGSPRALLFDAQLKQAERIAGEAKKPENPLDDDNH